MGRTVTLWRGYSKIWALIDSSSLQHPHIDLSKLKILCFMKFQSRGTVVSKIILKREYSEAEKLKFWDLH